MRCYGTVAKGSRAFPFATVRGNDFFGLGVALTFFFQTPKSISWSPSPDGKRFLFLVAETQNAEPFTVVLNGRAAPQRWFIGSKDVDGAGGEQRDNRERNERLRHDG